MWILSRKRSPTWQPVVVSEGNDGQRNHNGQRWPHPCKRRQTCPMPQKCFKNTSKLSLKCVWIASKMRQNYVRNAFGCTQHISASKCVRMSRFASEMRAQWTKMRPRNRQQRVETDQEGTRNLPLVSSKIESLKRLELKRKAATKSFVGAPMKHTRCVGVVCFWALDGFAWAQQALQADTKLTVRCYLSQREKEDTWLLSYPVCLLYRA